MNKSNFWERFFGFTLNVNPILNLIGIVALVIRKRGRLKFIKKDKYSLYIWLLFTICSLLSVLFAYDKAIAISSFFIPFVFLGLYILGRWYIDSPTIFLKDVIRGTAFMALLILIFYLFNVDVFINDVAIITKFHQGGRGYILGIADNGLGILLQVGIVASLGMLFISKKRRELFEYLIYFFLSVGALIITNSRGAMLGTAFGVILISIVISWIIIFIFGGAIGILFSIIPGFFERVKSIFILDIHSTRLSIYKNTLNMIRDHFWFGTGPGNFHNIYPQYMDVGDKMSMSPHSNYLYIMSGWGLPCAILFYGWIFFIMLRGWYKGGNKYKKIIVAILVSFWIHVLINDLFAVYAAVLLGCLDNINFEKLEDSII